MSCHGATKGKNNQKQERKESRVSQKEDDQHLGPCVGAVLSAPPEHDPFPSTLQSGLRARQPLSLPPA